jgi:hypothetical protein
VGPDELAMETVARESLEQVPASARFYAVHFGFQPRVELDRFTTLVRRYSSALGASRCANGVAWDS